MEKSNILKMLVQEEKKLRYSAEELKEFEAIITSKLEIARKELSFIRDTLNKRNDNGTENTKANHNVNEDGSENLEKESLNQLAARQQKFIGQLEGALNRIRTGNYGVCIETGKLIPKERLRAVPHTQHSIEAKLAKL